MGENNYYPAIIIGAGGTGVRTLRYLVSLAEERDGALKRMLDCGAIQTVALDTDPKSNRHIERVDPNLVGLCNDTDFGTESPPKMLQRIRHTWVHLDRQGLNRAVPRLHDLLETGSEGDEAGMPLSSIIKWFPPRDQETKEGLTLGHSKLAGAAQWRPLGRLSFFLNAKRIHGTLQKALKDVRNASPGRAGLRAFVICSLAGGTGSGMFWDLAFMLQMLEPELRTTGMFLLGDAFESLDEAGRIHPNIYGALKEIAYMKNWEREFQVEYLLDKYVTFKGTQNGPLAFDDVFLYQSFMPGQKVDDRAKATLDVTCFRTAQNVMSHLRQDLYRELDQGANNSGSDATARVGTPERTYAFSTSATIWFHLRGFKEALRDIKPALLQRFCKRQSFWEKEYRRQVHQVAGFFESLEVLPDQRQVEGQGEPLQTLKFDLDALLKEVDEADEEGYIYSGAVHEQLNKAIEKLKGLKDQDYKKWINFRNLLLGVAEDGSPAGDLAEAEAFWDSFIEAGTPCEKLNIKPLMEALEKAMRAAISRRLDALEQALEHVAEGKRIPDQDLTRMMTWAQELRASRSRPQMPEPPEIDMPPLMKLIVQRLLEKEGQEPGGLPMLARWLDGTRNNQTRLVALAVTALEQVLKALDPAHFGADFQAQRRTFFEALLAQEVARRQLHAKIKTFCEQQQQRNLREEQAHQKRVEIQGRLAELIDTSKGQVKQTIQDEAQQRKAQGLAAHHAEADSMRSFLHALTPTHMESKIDGRKWIRERAQGFRERLRQHLLGHQHADDFQAWKELSTDQLCDYWTHFVEQQELLLSDTKESRPERALLDHLENLVRLEVRWSDAEELVFYEQPRYLASEEGELDSQGRLAVVPLKAWPQSEAELKVLRRRVELLCQVFMEYCLGQMNLAMLHGDGEQALKERIHRSRSPIFAEGVGENPLNRKHLVIIPFQEGLERSGKHQDDLQEIREQFEWLSEEILHTKPTIVNQETHAPLIYYNDKFRSAEEIKRIGDYFRAYMANGKYYRTLFHIHPMIADWPEILRTNREPFVSCGNIGCLTNICNWSRSKKICDGCRHPIWNRCGNHDCHANDIWERVRQWQKQRFGRCGHDVPMPHHCPVCSQHLDNFWWYCPYHQQPNPYDKISCKTCQEEVVAGTRRPEDVSRRLDKQVQPCHGCPSTPDPKKRVELPFELISYYRNGINGSQARTIFLELIQNSKKRVQCEFLDPHQCPNGTHLHYLFPTCPVDRCDPVKQHHVYRGRDDHFHCTAHPELQFYKCDVCEYPLTAEEAREGGCLRCLSNVQFCHYCSEGRKGISRIILYRGLKRCGHCCNLADPENLPLGMNPGEGLTHPAFCRNIYGCDAGRAIWSTASDYDLGECRVCPDPPPDYPNSAGSIWKSKLLPLEEQRELVLDCPLCTLVTSPVPNGVRQDAYQPKKVVEKFLNKYFAGGQNDNFLERLKSRCPICTTRYISSLRWITSDSEVPDSFFSYWTSMPETIKQEIPLVPLAIGLEVLRTLFQEQDNRTASMTLRKKTKRYDISEIDPALLVLFPPGSLSHEIVGYRLRALLKEQNELNMRRDTGN